MTGDTGRSRCSAERRAESPPRMEARFAGSQRLGGRRRRLAVEADEVPSSGGSAELSAPAGRRRVAHSSAAGASVSGAAALPLEAMVPVEWWKYLIGALVGVLVAGGTVAAGWYAPLW